MPSQILTEFRHEPAAPPRPGGRKALALFLLLVVGGGLAIGLITLPGTWYAGLAKPPFNPPNWIFGPVWTILYVLIALAGWRAWLRREARLQRLWWAQLALNFLWSPVFFGAQLTGPALVVILALLAVILAFTREALRRDRAAAALFAPYALWVAFASLLNASIFWLNG